MKLTPHPVAALFPLMDDAELQELAEDIQRNGLLTPIVVQRSTLLDGRNRLRACELAKVVPITVEWQGQGNPALWIVSMNLKRRHLTPAQSALLASRLKEHLTEAVNDQRVENIKKSKHLTKSSADRRSSGKAARLAAKATGSSTRSVERASRLRENGSPALVAAVEKGEVSLYLADKVLDRPKPQQLKAAKAVKARQACEEAYNRNQQNWHPVLSGFEIAYGNGRDTRAEEAPFFRHFREAQTHLRFLLCYALNQWVGRTRMELMELEPVGRRATEHMERATKALDELLAGLNQEVAA